MRPFGSIEAKAREQLTAAGFELRAGLFEND
jgi:hypothetical protein